MNDEARGEEARRILGSEVYKEAYAQVEANIVAQLAQASTKAEDAESLRQLLIALRKVKVYMEQVIATGTMVAMDKKRANIKDLLRRRA